MKAAPLSRIIEDGGARDGKISSSALGRYVSS